MAKKKRKRTTPAKKHTGAKTKHTTRKKKRKKPFLSEMISHEGLKKTGKSYFGGLVGGGVASAIESLMPANTHVGWKVLANGVVALVAGAGFDMPSVSAGMGGATGYQLGQTLTKKLLSEMEEEEMADDDSLSDYPDAMDENGNPMYLADDSYIDRGLADSGEFYYLEELEEMELADNQFALAESFQGKEMYPRYVNSSMF